MATGTKISGMPGGTSFDGSDLVPIVQSGVNKSITHDILFDDPHVCKAWVAFNGSGTLSIRDSFNVSSVTDNSTGNYTVNFANALSDANYSVGGSAMAGNAARVATLSPHFGGIYSTAALQVLIINTNDQTLDSTYASVQVYGS
jgi:hypothetical protein